MWSLMTFCPSAAFKIEYLEALARWNLKNRLTDDDLQRPCYDDYDIILLEFSLDSYHFIANANWTRIEVR